MSNADKNPMRWLETTPKMQAVTPAETANNIPSRRLSTSSLQEESKTGPFMKTTTLAKPAAATTTTTMFDTATAVAGKNSGSETGLLVNRVTASPAIIKTQIAKISYTHSDDRSPTHSNRKYVKPPMTTMIQRLHLETQNQKTPTTQRSSAHPLEPIKNSTEEYTQTKNERELEIRETQEMLHGIKNTPILNEVTTQTSNHLLERTNQASKFEEDHPNESPKKISNDNKPNISGKSAENKSALNTQRVETTIPIDLEQLSIKEPEKPAPTSATSSFVYQRSKTDILLTKAATTRRRKPEREPHNEPRSKSTQPPVTKSSELLPDGSPDKKKFYDPQELRRFMEEQRKKRQKTLEYLNSYRNQQQNEKEQIKRRLEELNKYSRKVVSKNLKNAQKRTGSRTAKDGGTATSAGAIDEASPRKTAKLDSSIFKRTQGRKNQLNKNVAKSKKHTANEQKTNAHGDDASIETGRKMENEEMKEKQKESQNKVVVNKENGNKPSALMENQKRIGLLRKPEIKDHSFGAIKEFSFDKENVALELLTPKLTTTVEQSRVKEKIVAPQTMVELHPVVEKTEQSQPPDQSKQIAVVDNLTLEMPEARLQRTRVVREQATQVRESESLKLTGSIQSKLTTPSSVAHTEGQNERTELPYWLKPSAVQVYPYNFIMAVRRKLEAIANPTPQLIPNRTKSCEATKEHKKPAETPLSSMPKEREASANQQNVKRRLLVPDIEEKQSHVHDIATHRIEKVAKKSTDNISQSKRTPHETQLPGSQLFSLASLSDMTSNFSSISLVMPVSNTCSEVSSIISDSKLVHCKQSKSAKSCNSAEEDNTTASSSIFNSPEKQKRREKKYENEEFKMPRPVSPLSLESVEHLKISSKVKETKRSSVQQETADVEEVDFNRLLEDFNRSLSQVIEVNEQLKSTLDKSHQLLSPERKHSSKNSKTPPPKTISRHIKTEDEYSTDFEGGSSIHSELEQLPTKAIKKDSSPQQRKNLFELANKVKPLPTSSKSEPESDAVQNSAEKNTATNLDINIESASNSSGEQTSPSKTTANFSSRAVSAENSLEKRFESIERLKDNLRQSILLSKAHRNEIQTKADRLIEDLSDSDKGENDQLQLLHISSKLPKSSTSLSNSTTNSHNVSSRRSLFPLQSSSERSDIKTALCESEDNADASAPQTAEADMIHSTQSPSVADKSYTFDSKSNSPKAKTFTITQNVTTYSSPAQKSINNHMDSEDNEEETIAEEIQNIVTTPKQNELQKSNKNSTSSSVNSSPQKSKHSATKAAYDKAHINRSRGDFMPATDDEYAAKNESNFQAAATAAAANNSRTDSDSAAPPPSYKALSATVKRTTHSPISLSEKSEFRQQKSTNKSSKLSSSHELITLYNQSDMELSIISSRNGSISETSLNYSSVGMYEKLIQSETTKSEQLTVLLKMREKALLDRTKGQIAWLELQKERYKAKGLLMQITAIKKKQRGILLKMEKEREEIKRLLQSTTSTTSTHSSTRHQYHHQHSAGQQNRHQQQQTASPKRKRAEPSSAPPLLLPPLPILTKSTRSNPSAHQQQQHQEQQKIATAHSAPIIRANYDLESNRTLEELLLKREADLRKRREHVERLIRWHQRLDQEEAEVQQLELMLLNCNNVHAQPLNNNQTPQQWQQQKQQQQLQQHTISIDKQRSHEQLTAVVSKTSPNKKQGRDAKMERRLKEIDKSLRELSSISVSNNSGTSTDESATTDADYVRTSGSKLNKLWRRLTTQQVERFEPARRYKLCKADLERIYEEAKVAVLRDFAQDEQRIAVELLDKTTATVLSQSSLHESLNQEAAENTNNKIVIPRLNLNFSSGQSDAEDAMVQNERHERGDDSTASLTEAISTQSTFEPPTTPQADTYSPITAEEEFVRQETSNNNSSSSITASSSGSNSTSPEQSKLAPRSSPQSIARHREELLERNVQKFMELTQRFNSAQAGDGLQRSLSDTQIAENCSGSTKKSSNKASMSQRNIAYYGVKTQKRPSKVVNVEIANSLSSASSILTASNTLRSVQSINTQALSPESTRDSKSVSADNVNNIPSPVSTVMTAEESSRTSVASSAIDKLLDSHGTEASKTVASTSVGATNETTMSAAITPSTSANLSELAPMTHSDAQAQQISEKLEEISAAMSKLTQSNSLLLSSQNSFDSKQSSQQLNIDQSTKSASAVINTEAAKSTTSNSQSYSYTFEPINEASEVAQLNSPLETSTVPSSLMKIATTSPPQSPPQAAAAQKENSEALTESMLLNKYEADFEDSLDETRLEDISLPQFETTNESSSTQNEEDDVDESEKTPLACGQQSNDLSAVSTPAILTKTTNKLSTDSAPSLPPPPMPPPPPPPSSAASSPQLSSSISKEAVVTFSTTTNNSNNNNSNNNTVSSSSQPQLMPDIINELELRRCQAQVQQYEHVTTVPYNMYMREIPNKPPPPYVPPAHGSPMTTIFPSEERIKDLTYRRTHELYCEILKTEYTNEKGEKLPSVLAEKITNIYERIILDICREYLEENRDVLTKSDPSTFHGNLAFFNPPDRLSCLQRYVYKEVRRCLAMDKKQPKRSQVYSVYGQRAKRDHIGKIIIQEMYDEDDKWCNFHHEEAEVLDLIIEEMVSNLVGDLAKEVLLEEGGIVEENVVATEVQEEEISCVTNDETIYEDASSLIDSITSALDDAASTSAVIETVDTIEERITTNDGAAALADTNSLTAA